MSAPILTVEGLSKSYGGFRANHDISFAVEANRLHAVIGPNGAGKTTLISLLCGDVEADSGRIVFDGCDVTTHSVARRARAGLARSFQITSVFVELTVLENTLLAVQGKQGGSLRFFSASRRARQIREARELLDQVGLVPFSDRPVATLAYGERRRLEIAMTLAGEPRLLLLDEPMAGAGHEESRQIVELLDRLRGRYAILLVEHDMDAVFALADHVTVMVAGSILACGRPDRVRSDPAVQEAYLGTGEFDECL